MPEYTMSLFASFKLGFKHLATEKYKLCQNITFSTFLTGKKKKKIDQKNLWPNYVGIYAPAR